jgi:hypothetical protein
MPQQTNLNVAPYFDDFSASNDFHKVLFKPGFPVQARELTTTQSILQNQIEQFGQHFFKEGTKVIPGNTTYQGQYFGVQLNNTYQGVPVSAYADQLIGTKVTGLISGVTAYVKEVLLGSNSDTGNLTLYVDYLSTSTVNNSQVEFSNSEQLTCNTDIRSGLLGNSTINANTPFGQTVPSGASIIGSSFSIQEGVYFLHGNFVNVQDETLVLDQYSSKPNYRIGLNINEEIITADLDQNLNDNSQGYNNFAAPGADRLKITASLFKKPLDDFEDSNFVELATVKNGNLRRPGKTADSPFKKELTDTTAKRTFETNGDYTLSPFNVTAKECLNDNEGNNGMYDTEQFTDQGDVPTEDKFVYKVSSGTAFVKGYEVRKVRPTLVDVPKPRTTFTVEDESIIYNTGPTLKVNRVFGTPGITTAHNTIVSLRDSRIGAGHTGAAGNEIGLARIYDFRLESGSYNTVSNLNEWDISLYDIQTTTEITLNTPSTFGTPTHIEGANSGATGFLFNPVTDNATIEVYETNGNFVKFEPLIINGIQSGKIATAVTAHSISDVKSIFSTRDVGATPYSGTVGLSSIFNADVIQSTEVSVGIATISAASGGVSTVTSPNPRFPGNIVKVDNLVEFSNPDQSNDPTYGKVTAVGTNTIIISNVADVDGIVNGSLPTTNKNVTDFKILTTDLAKSSDNTLYTELPHTSISSLDLTNATIAVRRPYTVSINGGETSSVNAGENEKFLPFDDERYSLIRTDGTTEVLTSDKFIFTNGGSTLKIGNLGSNTTNVTLVASLRKTQPTSKVKIRDRVNSIIVNKSKLDGSGIGSTTIDNGLEYGNYPFGTRIEDNLICLNTPDVINLYGIFESGDDSDPSAPTVTLNTINSASTTTAEYIVGEKIVGQTSGAVAVVASIKTANQIEFIYTNEAKFEEGEKIQSKESKVTATITTIDESSFNITDKFKWTDGQADTIYNFGYIKRNADADAPTRKVKIYFLSAYYDTNDRGSITTVDSYRSFNYSTEIQVYNGVRNTDIIDIRPRVNVYSVAEGTRSPLEFLGRNFDASGNSSANILASDESLLTTFSYYLGRIDVLCLNKTGKIQLVQGTPAELPQKPAPNDDSIELAVISLPAFLPDAEQVSISSEEQQRYTMADIRRLEKRIQNLEYYTSLTLLETSTSNLFVSDNDGLNRFKSGFFVDNFENFITQDERYIKNSIDTNNKELRPSHYTTAVDLMFGPVVNINPLQDPTTAQIEGINVRRNNGIVTLDYSEVEWLKQEFATRSVSVTPFIVPFWNGVLFLTPQSDTWIDTVRVQARTIVEGNFNEQVARARDILGRDPQIGFVNTRWNSWEITWAGQTQQSSSQRSFNRNAGGRWRENVVRQVNLTTQEQRRRRSGTTVLVTETMNNVSLGDRIISRDLITFVRSRNVQFTAQGIKPLTRVYAFFDGREVSRFCVPKLLQISMSSGAFQSGETVIGRLNGSNRNSTSAYIQFRVANPNHSEGGFNVPTRTYSYDPYTQQSIPTIYSSTSTLLNVDVASLSDISQTDFFGWVASGMQLTGQTSGAQATISDVQLVATLSGNMSGSYFIPNPNNNTFPTFETGPNLFRLTSDTSNGVDAVTSAEQEYLAQGTLNTVREDIISTRNATLRIGDASENDSINAVLNRTVDEAVTSRWRTGGDPLAQSFTVDNAAGVFLSRFDCYFRTKDDSDVPVNFSIRTMENGLPTQQVVPMSEVILEPDDVQLSTDSTTATSFVFRSPIYLEAGKEYAMVLLSNSAKYSVYISRVGEFDLSNQTYVANQPLLGSLFKSQNASTWEPSQWEDLKFNLYRADFVESGSFDAYNPQLNFGNGQMAKLMPDSLNLVSKTLRVGLGTTVGDPGLNLGNTIIQGGTQATANYVGSAGTAAGLDITNVGLGYTPAASQLTFSGVNLVTLTGNGRNATADITIASGSIVSSGATIVNGGTGYQIGDVLGISTIGANSIGRNAKLSITSIGSTSELILENVQGNFVVGSANTLSYISSTGITTEVNGGQGGGVQIASIETVSDGLHIKVNHKNHGMYSTDNKVRIMEAETDLIPTKLAVALNSGNETQISVTDASQFTTFEGVGIGSTNLGYATVGSEIISYTSVSGNVLGNVKRAVGYQGEDPVGLNGLPAPVGASVVKYELGGVNLMRINKPDGHDVVDEIGFDSYNIKLDMSTKFNVENDDRGNDVGFPQLFIGKTKSAGGNQVEASQNIPYEIITPMLGNVTLPGTSVNADIRSVTGTSLNGNEVSFLDNGFESINPNSSNYLSTPRLIASTINANNKLTTLPGEKSLDMKLTLNTTDSWLSPIIDGERLSAILTSNRVNVPVTDYATNAQVKTINNDPNACQYISKEMELENTGTALKIILNAHMHFNTDIRAFYAINNEPNMDPVFVPFPGYTNLNSKGEVITPENNDGLPDKFVTKSNDYGQDPQSLSYPEYVFSIDELPSYRYYRIKLILTSTNQVHVPRIRKLRVMALA